MKDFLKYTLASCLGITIAFFAFAFFSVIFFVALFASFSTESSVALKEDSILKIELKEFIPEMTNNTSSSTFDFSDMETIGMRDIIKLVEHASQDENIIAIELELAGPTLNVTATNDLLDALENFSQTGKPIFVHSIYYSQVEYYIASVADHISINPFGGIDFRGFGILAPFLTDFLDIFGVHFNVYYAGEYKGAGENFYRRDFSEENREQLSKILDESYSFFLNRISDYRDIPVEDLQNMANNLLLKDEYAALEYKMVDAVEDKMGFELRIKEMLGLDVDESLRKISVNNYKNSVWSDIKNRAKDQIAVIFAEGSILDGKSEGGIIADETYINTINKIRDNDNIKAVVLRVNSGGGSVIASDNIYNALVRLKESGKPLVVSMGDFAASGGYYIACASEYIFAEKQTITGSIGVFSMIPNFSELVNDKLKIHFDTISTAPYALKFNPSQEFTQFEHDYYQEMTDQVYGRFVNLVANSRNMSFEEANSMANGRVWMANSALEGGLIDQIGGLEEATNYIADLAGIDEYRIREYPQIKDPFLRFVEEITGETMSLDEIAMKRLKSNFAEMVQLQEWESMEGLQARIPYLIKYK